jgi:hypothetical protein
VTMKIVLALLTAAVVMLLAKIRKLIVERENWRAFSFYQSYFISQELVDGHLQGWAEEIRQLFRKTCQSDCDEKTKQAFRDAVQDYEGALTAARRLSYKAPSSWENALDPEGGNILV